MLVKPPLDIAEAVIKTLADFDAPTRKDVMMAIRKTIKNTDYAFPTSIQLWEAYRKLLSEGLVKNDSIERALKVKDVRTDSGVAPVTVLTKPFPCPGNCVYCPTEYRMPKSYISSEPAAARALSLNFDPYEQVRQRVKALETNGHTANKIELIIKGGTWSAYPEDYREWFITRCFEAANELESTPSPLSGEPAIKQNIESFIQRIPHLLNKITEFSYIPYRNDLKALAVKNRHSQTPAEQKIWNEILSNRRLCGLKFLRQKPLGHYIADFYCPRLLLILEIDDKSHQNKIEQDTERDKFLKSLQIETIRYTNQQVCDNIQAVKNDLIIKIYNHLLELTNTISPDKGPGVTSPDKNLNTLSPDKGPGVTSPDKGPGVNSPNKGPGVISPGKGLVVIHRANQTAAYRIIGLTIETRPDHITPAEVIHLRKLGVTRVELGLQIINDRVLKITNRGTTVADAVNAIALLKAAAFKVDVHIIPGQPGASREDDLESFKTLFEDPRFRPDMIKLYPCVVLPNSELYEWTKRGEFKPLEGKELRELLIEMQSMIPYYCRVSRLIRDFPTADIAEGNKQTNLRESVENEMKLRGIKCKCLRCREVGHVPGDHTHDQTKIFEEYYENAGGTEVFLSVENLDRTAVFGFCRLRLPQIPVENDAAAKIYSAFPILKTSAQIRELHTYGTALNINTTDASASQHKGYGKKLMAHAEAIAKDHDYKNIAVISGIGVREYYKTLGYHEEDTYMVKKISH